MALSELVALETAYRAMQPLDTAARRRGLRWLKDALDVPTSHVERGEPATGSVPEALESASDDGDGGSVESLAGGDEAQTASATATRRTPSRRAAKRTRSSGAAKSSAGDPGNERVYRRMPPAEDVLRAYAEVGTISGLAEYFNVPRHTVQGWARRMRSAGHVIGRKA